MTDIPLLSLTIFLPLLGALVILLIKEDETSVGNIRKVALWTSIGVFLLSLLIWLQFDNSKAEYQFQEKIRWFSDFNFYFFRLFKSLSIRLFISLCVHNARWFSNYFNMVYLFLND